MLRLQSATYADLPYIVQLEQNSSNAAYVMPNTAEEHSTMLSDPNIEHLILRDQEKSKVGYVLLAGLQDESKSIELRRLIIDQKGRGYGRKAIDVIKIHCFTRLKANRLWLDAFSSNERARHLYLRAGFSEEVLLRESYRRQGIPHNLVVMSILRNEYMKQVI